MSDLNTVNKYLNSVLKDDQEDSWSFKEAFNRGKSFIKYLAGKWMFLLLIGGIGAAIGYFLYEFQKPKFEAESTFILEEKQGGMGSLSGLASQFGFDLGGTGGASLFAGDNILEILKSKKIVRNALLSPIDTSSNKKLIDVMIESNGWKEKWKDNDRLKDVNFTGVTLGQSLTLPQDSVLGLAHKMLIKNNLTVERLIKKGSMIRVSVKSSNEKFAKVFVERIIDDAKKMYVQVKTNSATTNVNRLERKADSLLRLLNAKAYQAAGSYVIDANPGLITSSVPTEIKQRDKIVLQTIYGEVVKNLEVSRIALMQQTPVIEILDSPSYPLVDKRKSALYIILIATFIALFIASGFFLLKYLLK